MVWDTVLKVLVLIGITFVPALELRASIPYGLFMNGYKETFHWSTVVIICVLANIGLAFVFYWLLDTFIKWLRQRWAWFARLYERLVARAQRKIHKHVEKYGEWGIALFIGVPLPGTGVITGALASYAMGLNRKKYYVASILGVLIAATAVTLVCLLGDAAVRKWFIKEI
jgi:uncharacterized membrane protein